MQSRSGPCPLSSSSAVVRRGATWKTQQLTDTARNCKKPKVQQRQLEESKTMIVRHFFVMNQFQRTQHWSASCRLLGICAELFFFQLVRLLDSCWRWKKHLHPDGTCGEASTGHDARCGLYFPAAWSLKRSLCTVMTSGPFPVLLFVHTRVLEAAFPKRIFAIHCVANSGFRMHPLSSLGSSVLIHDWGRRFQLQCSCMLLSY